MNAKNNSGTDIDVLTTFQPMPKRFMLYDKVRKTFLTRPLDLEEIIVFFTGEPANLFDDAGEKRFIFCQSTNLFDKDGKEIFEGHIVRVGGETGIVQMICGEWHAIGDDDIPLSVWKPSGIEILGHSLSNPELMEK